MLSLLASSSCAAPHRDAFEMISAGPSTSPGTAWSVGANLTCPECERVVRNLKGYCDKQRPLGDLDLHCFDCTWAHEEMPGCQRIMALIAARPQPIPEPSADCCLTKCACIPTCDGCMGPPPPPPPVCECLEPDAAKSALHALRKFCSSFKPVDQARWVAQPGAFPFDGHYQIPQDFTKFCAMHTPFAVEGDQPDEACQEFLQRLTASSRPEPAAICELACENWCDPCCHTPPPPAPSASSQLTLEEPSHR